jgi:hypothetical protein
MDRSIPWAKAPPVAARVSSKEESFIFRLFEIRWDSKCVGVGEDETSKLASWLPFIEWRPLNQKRGRSGKRIPTAAACIRSSFGASNWSSYPSRILGTSDASRHARRLDGLPKWAPRTSPIPYKFAPNIIDESRSIFTSMESPVVGQSNVPDFSCGEAIPSHGNLIAHD